ncbi:alpha/beta fold hydrolase [Hymenobacter terrenus]|uniref:alpha/beta fold hydrolase n=1 Tax=Hymenobacter terrenus TaxID=1629124 RepID=UPI000619BD98|nr:alpha/beta hydrolase [Hymenobacter terrenus]
MAIHKLVRLVGLAAGLLVVLGSCQREDISVATRADDAFYVRSNGADMPVRVKGNTASQTFMLMIHGGPGGNGAFFELNRDAVRPLEEKMAVVYWDQRFAGSSQGNPSRATVTAAQYGEDVRKVLLVLKARYGADSKLFILGESWGGFVAPAFMTAGNNQALVKGWIHLVGGHNFRLQDSLTREMIREYAGVEIAKGKKVGQWEELVRKANAVNFQQYNLDVSKTMSLLGEDATELTEEYQNKVTVDGIVNVPSFFRRNDFSSIANLLSYVNPSRDDANTVAVRNEYSSKLHLVTVPVLIMNGKYDFLVPPKLGEDALRNLGSVHKKLLIFDKSSHDLIAQEPRRFHQEVQAFVEEFK